MSSQHSPQEREIERFITGSEVIEASVAVPRKLEVSRMLPSEDGEWVRFEDHQAALQDREAELREAALIAVEDQSRQRSKAEARANRAEAARDDWKQRAENYAHELNEIEAHPHPAEDALRELQLGPDTLTQAGLKIVLAALCPDTSIGDREPEKGEKHDWKTAHFGMHWKCQRCGQTLVVHGEVPPPTFGCKPPAPCSDPEFDFDGMRERAGELRDAPSDSAAVSIVLARRDRASTQGGDGDEPATQTGGSPVVTGGEPDGGLALDKALAALDEIAAYPTVERNPDGEDQAAETMALLAWGHAARIRAERSPTQPAVPVPSAIVIDGDEFEEARRDPRVKKLLADADAYGRSLKERDHSVPSGASGDWPAVVIARDEDGALEVAAAVGDDRETAPYSQAGFELRRYVPAETEGER